MVKRLTIALCTDFGKVMNERKHDVRLHGKPAIRSLDPVMTADPSDFIREPMLIGRSANMFDDGVAEHDVEGRVFKWQKAAIAARRIATFSRRCSAEGKIDYCQMGSRAGKLPDKRRAAHIQNARAVRYFEGLLEQPHAPRPEVPERTIEETGLRHGEAIDSLESGGPLRP